MTSTNFSNSSDLEQQQEPARLVAGDKVPFFMRAWWLRNYKEYERPEWYTDPSITGPLWSPYSDPFCDTGSLDYYDGY